MFYHEGIRKVVEMKPEPNGLWHIFANHSFAGSIRNDGKKWEFYCEEGSCITETQMARYLSMITDRKIRGIS